MTFANRNNLRHHLLRLGVPDRPALLCSASSGCSKEGLLVLWNLWSRHNLVQCTTQAVCSLKLMSLAGKKGVRCAIAFGHVSATASHVVLVFL